MGIEYPMSFNTNTDILAAGAFAALAVDILVYPLDTIKTRIQSPDYKKIYLNASTNTINKSFFRGLYQGVGSVVIATTFSAESILPAGVFFTTYEGTKSLLHRLNPTIGISKSPLVPTPLIHSAASATAELVSCFILTPAEVLKQNAQMVKKSASASTQAFDANATIQALRKFNKPSQLWRGYTALAARNLPFTAMQFPMFEHLKQVITTYRQRRGIGRGTTWEKGIITAISAGSAGSVAAVITTPVDVIKTRMMLSAANSEATSVSGAQQAQREVEKQGKDVKVEIKRLRDTIKSRGGRAGMLVVGKEVFRRDGIPGLFRGGALRAVWTAFGSGLYLGVYESGRSFLEERRRRLDGSES